MIHLDFFGEEVKPGDFVIGSYSGGPGPDLSVFEIVRVTNKMIKIRLLSKKEPVNSLRYARNFVKITDSQYKALTFEAIRKSK